MEKLACIVPLLFLALKQSSQSTLTLLAANSGFCYKEQRCGPDSDKWPGICKTGQNQSPIDVPYNSTANERAAKPMPLFFNSEYRAPYFYIRNNGHSIQVSFSPDLTSNAVMFGYGLENPYIFAQLHFHWGSENKVGGSEHTINGKQFAAEAHFVHYNSKYATFQAAIDSEDPKALSVVAVFLEPINIPDLYDNPAFRKIAQNMPLNFQETVQKINSPINLRSMLPQPGDIFYKYSGSLTTPGCNEEVQWTIVPKPIQVSVKNYRKFYSVRDEDGHIFGENYRPVQTLNARTIQVFRKI